MNAYLQPGDKIHITVPGDFASGTRGQRKLEEIVAAYRKLGIEVFQATPVIHSEQVTIVAVFREPKPLRPLPNLGKAPWQDPDKLGEPLRARWDARDRNHWSAWYGDVDPEPDPPAAPPEAMEPPQAHPGYQDHPRVP